MYKSQADAVKEWLQTYQLSEKHINLQLEKLRTLQAQMRSVGAQQLSDMPRPPSAPKDRMADYVAKVEALEQDIDEETKQLEECRETILEITGELKRVDACKLIRLRYLRGYEWSEITEALYGSDKPWTEKEQTAYKRRTYRLHDSALAELAKLWKKGSASDRNR